jgi:S-adenosylmethionine:tRNA ribosyltransferase-isomerase
MNHPHYLVKGFRLMRTGKNQLKLNIMRNHALKNKSSVSFPLSDELSAKKLPEVRGINRDHVKLFVIDRNNARTYHSAFNHLSDFLRRGDLLIFNSSRTLPASLKTINYKAQQNLEVRLAEHLPDDSWLVLFLYQNKNHFHSNLKPGLKIEFDAGLSATIIERNIHNPRLWKIKFSANGPELINIFNQIGKPIHYGYISAPLPLEYFLTVFAKDPVSTEMPSAGRAFTWKMLFDLKNKGIDTAFLTLHTGLSSYLDDDSNAGHLIAEEEYFISQSTAEKIESNKAGNGRIVAVGTSVVRAIESSALQTGKVVPGNGYTTLRMTEKHKLKIADGLITGFHEPQASHLDLISAFLSPSLIKKTYEEAIEKKYLWHEFGDLCLIL